MRLLCRDVVAISFLALLATSAPAQQELAAPFSSVGQLAHQSGYIFSGTVIAVQRTSAAENAVASTQIAFRVDEAIQGVRSREILTIREWFGLWDSGERYRPGERVLLFLYPTSKLGFTSPVGGAMGRFAVDHAGNIHISDPRRTFFSSNHTRPQFAGRTRVSTREFAQAILALRNEYEQIR